MLLVLIRSAMGGTSNEYHNIIFYAFMGNKKNISTFRLTKKCALSGTMKISILFWLKKKVLI